MSFSSQGRSVMRVCLAFGVIVMLAATLATPALALTRAKTREVQEKLTILGYEPGPIDGRFGSKTRAAVRAFQEDSELKVDGIVGRQTLGALDLAADRGVAPGRKPAAANTQMDIYEDALTDRLQSGPVTLASRYGQVEISGAARQGYTLTVNGQPVGAPASGSRALPRISRPFQMPGEDAYIFATYGRKGKGGCGVEHTLLVVRQDGSVMNPVPVGNCEEILNARVQDNTLVMSFPPRSVPSWRLEESWVYQNGQVEQK